MFNYVSKDFTLMCSWQQFPPDRETEEERRLRQMYEYEALQKSYTQLEPLYEKFLVDSGLSRSGYWRGAGES